MPLSRDKVYFKNNDEYFRIFNFQRSENIQEVIDVILGKREGQPRIVKLNGLKGIGKEYIVRAAAYEASALGHPTRVAAMDLAGWNPDTGTLDSYLESLTERLAKEVAQRLKPLLDEAAIAEKKTRTHRSF